MLIWAWLIAFVAFIINFLISIIPFYLLYVLGLRSTASDWLFFNNRVLSAFLLFLAGVKLNIKLSSITDKLIKEGKPVCFFSNHTSMLDIPAVVLATKAKTGFIAKDILRKIPVLNLIAFAMKCIFINRKDKNNSVNGIRQGVKILNSGHSMLIFPEGTRSKTGEIAPFKHGSFRLATEAEVPSIPVTVQGLRPAVEDRKFMFHHYDANIVIGDPVLISKSDNRDERFDKINKFEDLIRKTYELLGRKNV